jgi:purine-binding chemotaxis protein CheW
VRVHLGGGPAVLYTPGGMSLLRSGDDASRRPGERGSPRGGRDEPFVSVEDLARIEQALRAELDAPRAPPPDPLDEFFWREGEEAPALAEFGGPAPRVPSPEVLEERREWLSFGLAGEEYAVDIAQVREILKAPAITEVPRAPAHVLGVIMVRGEVIAVFDPRHRLGLPPAAPGRAARVIVCDAGDGDGSRGILVDAVSDVVRLPPSAVEARPHGVGGASAEYIVGIGREGTRLLILLDLAALLRDAPAGRSGDAP